MNAYRKSIDNYINAILYERQRKNCGSSHFINVTKQDFIPSSLLIVQVGIKQFCVCSL